MDTDPRSLMKQKSAIEALKYIKSGQAIGIGSGSTVAKFIEELGEKIQKKELADIICIPASYQSELDLQIAEIKIGTLHDYPELDICIDGTDQVDQDFNLIKGGGAALTREKILAHAAKEVLIIADNTKLVDVLGGTQPLPIEVLPFGLGFVEAQLRRLGFDPILRIAKHKNGPIITDNGNFIIDANIPKIKRPEEMADKLQTIPGIIEHGLFCNLVSLLIIGYPDKVQVIRPNHK